jgi:hypothetical protein
VRLVWWPISNHNDEAAGNNDPDYGAQSNHDDNGAQSNHDDNDGPQVHHDDGASYDNDGSSHDDHSGPDNHKLRALIFEAKSSSGHNASARSNAHSSPRSQIHPPSPLDHLAMPALYEP